jgi:CRP-like cAMP-binding protein
MDLNYEKINLHDYITADTKNSFESRNFPAHSVIYKEGEHPSGIFFITDGLVGLTYQSKNGAESLLRIFTSQSFLGHRSLFSNEPYHATATTLHETRALFIPKEKAMEMLLSNKELMVAFIKLLSRDLKNSEIRFRDMIGKRVESRVIEALFYLKKRHPDYVWTRREIGEFCGAKTETVSRVLTKLEKEGHIIKEGRKVLFRDEENFVKLFSDDEEN